ncbi:MAG: glycosyltransferase family 4 protein [Rhodospirillales bacterium]
MLDNAGPEPPGSADGPHSAGVTVLFLSPATEFVGGAEQSLMDLVANPAIHAVVATPGHGALAERAAQLGAGLRTFSYGAIADVRRPFKMRSVLTSFRDSIRLARQLARIAGEEKAQIIHSNGLKVHVVACLARLFGAPPVFVHIRDIPYTRTEAMVWHLFQLLASRIILVSRACWPGKALPRQARIIHNGVHVPLTTLPDHPPGRPIAIGFLGRISPLKGLRMLVEWIAQCRTAGLDIRLIVRGGVQPNNADYFREVQNTVASHHLESICRFDDERHGLEAIYENVDVIAVPSNIPDPLPRVVMEGMSLGLPVIGYPAGGIPDMIQPGKTGYLASTGAEFCDAVVDLVGTPGRFDEIRRNGFAWVRQNMTLDALYRNINREYRACVPKQRTHHG